METIMNPRKSLINYRKLPSDSKRLVIDILQEFVDNFTDSKVNIKTDLNGCMDADKYIKDICTDIYNSLVRNKHLTKKEVNNNKIDEQHNMGCDVDSKAKDLITKLPSFKLRCEYMSLNEILTADDLFNFLDKNEFENLKKVFDANISPTDLEDEYSGFTKEKMREFGSVLLNRVDVQENFESAQKAIKFYYQKLPELLKSQLINDKTSEYEKSSIEENSTPKLSFAWNLLKKYDENIKSGKIKDENGNGFKELQKCVADCTKDIFYEYKGISQHMKNISKLINMYETKDTTDFNSLNSQDLTESINFMMDFFIKKKLSKIWYWVCVCNKI